MLHPNSGIEAMMLPNFAPKSLNPNGQNHQLLIHGLNDVIHCSGGSLRQVCEDEFRPPAIQSGP
eukprot:5755140-Amphidinium_carterae.1